MKKALIFAVLACLLLSLAGCNAADTTPTGGSNPGSNTEAVPSGSTSGEATGGETEEGFVFNYNGTEIRMHAPAAPIIDALGEPKSYTEEASCAFVGLDKTYYYGSFYLDTYPVEEEDFVYGFWFADDSVTTEEGIYIGCTQAQVEKAYGAENYNGSNAYIVTKGDGKLTIILEDGIVTSIQYEIVLE